MSPKVFDQSGWLSGGVRTAGGLPTNPNNIPPVADFTYVPTALSVTFTSTSTDADGTITNTAWDFGDGTTGSGTPVTHVYGAAGPYTVTITVTDDDSAHDTASRAIAVVASGGTPPICDFSIAKSGLIGTFTDLSTDDGSIVSWLWDFGDGTTSTVQNPPPHTYATGGTKTVTLTVHDNAGNVGLRTRHPTFTAGSIPVFRKMISTQNMAASRFGISVTPDSEEQSSSANTWLGPGGYIDAARGAGSGGRSKTPPCILIFKCTPGNASLKDTNGDFVLKKWTDAFDSWVSFAMNLTTLPKPTGGTYTDGIAKLRDAVRDGTIAFHYALDDFGGSAGAKSLTGANGFKNAVSYADLEAMAYHQKVTKGMNWLPIGGRAGATNFKSRMNEAAAAGVVGPGGDDASTGYHYMDVAWCQIRLDLDGNVQNYIDAHCDAAALCKLRMKGGANLLNGGRWVWGDAAHSFKLHADVAWRQRRTGETDAQYFLRMHPDTSTLWGMSPSEITEAGSAMILDSRVSGFDLWRGDDPTGDAFAYWSDSEIQAAMLTNYTSASSLTDPPYNVRNDMTAA